MLRLEQTFLLWIIIGSFQATLGSKFYDTTHGLSSPCLSGTDCIPGQTHRSLKSQPHHPKLTRKYVYENLSSKDPCIGKFVDTFTAAVRSSQDLVELFDFFSHASVREFCNSMFAEILESLTAIGTPNPEFASQQAIESVSANFEQLSSDLVIQIYANAAGKFLYLQGILTPQNAAQLAKDYAASMEEAASCNDSQYVALNEGFVNFLYSLGLFTPDKGLLIALQFANEWKLLAKPKCG